MKQIFWESRHKARVHHHCDWCCCDIEPGQIYEREAWVARPGQIVILRRHSEPSCPWSDDDDEYDRQVAEREASLGVPVYIVAREVVVQYHAVNGETRSESRVEFVSTTDPPGETTSSFDDEPDIPF